MPKGGRDGGRQARRRRLYKSIMAARASLLDYSPYVANHAPPPAPERLPPPASVLEALLQAVKQTRREGEFGIEKLSCLDVDGAIAELEGRTLLEEAVRRGHSGVVNQLMRAGVDPTWRVDAPPPDEALAARLDATRLVVANAGDAQMSFHIMEIIDARLRWRSLEDRDALGACVFCGAEKPKAGVAYRCKKHVACEACCWNNCGASKLDMTLAPRRRLMLAQKVWVGCPCCPRAASARNLADVPPDAATLMPHFDANDDNNNHEEEESLPPEEIARRSRARYDVVNETPRAKEKLHFTALPHHLAQRQHLGLTRAHRDERMFDAASTGDVYRLAALIEVGCDICCRDDAGRTPLLIAAAYDHADAVRLLLRCGAQLDEVDNGGHAARDAASSRSASQALAVIDEWTGHLSAEQWSSRSKTSASTAGVAEPRGAAEACQRALSRLEPGRSTSSAIRLLNTPVDSLAYPTYEVDGIFDEAFLAALEAMGNSLPRHCARLEGRGRGSGNTDAIRISYFDATGIVSRGIASALAGARAMDPKFPLSAVQPNVKFLVYECDGGKLVPHTDLSKTCDETGMHTTHTLIIYLTGGPNSGGETVMLKKLPKVHEFNEETAPATNAGELHRLYRSACTSCCEGTYDEAMPRRGRLFVFPHDAPHLAMPVLKAPKLILRAEAY